MKKQKLGVMSIDMLRTHTEAAILRAAGSVISRENGTLPLEGLCFIVLKSGKEIHWGGVNPGPPTSFFD